VTVQEEERRRLSRELHDEVGGALTAIKMDVAVALRAVDAAAVPHLGARIVSWLEDARTIAENTLHDVRDLSQLLHPSMLDDFGLPQTLRSYLRSFSKRTGIATQFVENRMDQRLPQDVEVCVYRVVQEATTNTARHSGARNVVVTLSQTNGGLDVAVEDDGRGVDQHVRGLVSASARGLGVIGMRERVQALGGTFVLENRAGGGTRVAVHLPGVPSADGAKEPHSELLAG
jgi:signal transduction histidine kinase